MARTISRCWGVNVGAARTREPRLSAASVLRDGECWSYAGGARDGSDLFFAHKGGCVGRISPHPVHARRHHVDRQGRAVKTCHKHVDMKSVLLTQVYCL